MATPDVLILMFRLGALEFKILKFLYSCCLYIFLGNFPRFSVHKSLKILEKYIANFLKGYIDYLRTRKHKFENVFELKTRHSYVIYTFPRRLKLGESSETCFVNFFSLN